MGGRAACQRHIMSTLVKVQNALAPCTWLLSGCKSHQPPYGLLLSGCALKLAFKWLVQFECIPPVHSMVQAVQ